MYPAGSQPTSFERTLMAKYGGYGALYYGSTKCMGTSKNLNIVPMVYSLIKKTRESKINTLSAENSSVENFYEKNIRRQKFSSLVEKFITFCRRILFGDEIFYVIRY